MEIYENVKKGFFPMFSCIKYGQIFICLEINYLDSLLCSFSAPHEPFNLRKK